MWHENRIRERYELKVDVGLNNRTDAGVRSVRRSATPRCMNSQVSGTALHFLALLQSHAVNHRIYIHPRSNRSKYNFIAGVDGLAIHFVAADQVQQGGNSGNTGITQR